MAEFDLEIECSGCGASFRVPRIRAGRTETCPVCGAEVRVTLRGAEAPAAEQEPAPAGRQESPAPEPAPRRRPEPMPRVPAAGPLIVCAEGDRQVNPLAAGPLVCAYAGLPSAEGRMQVRRGMGVLGEGLGPDAARGMVKALERKGVGAFAVPQKAIGSLQRVLRMQGVYEVAEDALYVQAGREGKIRSVGWSAVVAGVCIRSMFGREKEVGSSRSSPTATYLAVPVGMGGVLRGGRRRRMPRHTPEPELEAVLVLQRSGGELCRLPFAESEVRYAYLGDQLKPSRAENFAQVLADVLRYAGTAFFPQGWKEAAEGHTERIRKVTGKLDRDNYVRWAVCCAAARGYLAA